MKGTLLVMLAKLLGKIVGKIYEYALPSLNREKNSEMPFRIFVFIMPNL